MRTALAFTFSVLAFGQAPARSAPQPTKIGAHYIGEPLQEWLALTHYLDDIDVVCKSKKRGIQGQVDKGKCTALERIRDGYQNKIGTGNDDRDLEWTFSAGKLSGVKIAIPGPFALDDNRPDIDGELAFLVQAYGKPSSVEQRTFQNAYGAKWSAPRLTWECPDGSVILASESINTNLTHGPRRELLILILSPESVEHAPPKPNPYKSAAP